MFTTLQTPTSRPEIDTGLFAALRPYMDEFLWCYHAPQRRPRNGEILATRCLARTRPKGWCTHQRINDDDHPWQFYCKPINANALGWALENNVKVFYASDSTQEFRRALPMFDVDAGGENGAHRNFQTIEDSEIAKAAIAGLFDELFPSQNPLFWCGSGRGHNGFLQIDTTGVLIPECNEIFARLQRAIQLFLADQKCLADFEMKGQIGKILGKLPLLGMNSERLKEFTSKPIVRIKALSEIADQIERKIPAAVLQKWDAHKEFLSKTTPRRRFIPSEGVDEAEAFGTLDYPAENTVSEIVEPEIMAGNSAPEIRIPKIFATNSDTDICKSGLSAGNADAEICKFPRPSKSQKNDLSGLAQEPDSWVRQHQAAMILARMLGRLPSVAELLGFVAERGLYTGTWEENESKRERRCRDILRVVGRTFNPKRRSESASSQTIKLGQYDSWVRNRFPGGFIGHIVRAGIKESGEQWSHSRPISVPPEFISGFMSLVGHFLLVDKKPDGRVRHDSVKDKWNELYAQGLLAVPFNDRRFAACRDKLVSLDIFRVPDWSYLTGVKTRCWAIGPWFPGNDGLGVWLSEHKSTGMSAEYIYPKNNNRIYLISVLLIEGTKGGCEPRFSLERAPP